MLIFLCNLLVYRFMTRLRLTLPKQMARLQDPLDEDVYNLLIINDPADKTNHSRLTAISLPDTNSVIVREQNW